MVYTVVGNRLSSDHMCSWVEIPSPAHLTDKPRNYKPIDINIAPSTLRVERVVYTVVGNRLSSDHMCSWVEIPSPAHLTDKPRKDLRQS